MNRKSEEEKSKVINVVFPPQFMEEVDSWVKVTGGSRSEFVRNAVRHYIVNFLKKQYPNE